MRIEDWIGRTQTTTDIIASQPARFMQATLDHHPALDSGDSLPPLWHWLYFLEALPANQLGRDAHPKKGGFLPPVDLPRRMWAGGRFAFDHPVIIGREATKRSTITKVENKTGRSGALCFVTVQHEIFQGDTLCLREEHDIVYREDPAPGAPQPVPKQAPDPLPTDISEVLTPNEALLFRYSALTFNGHRIHYDVDYARQVEGYDGLVFHGPLTATLLVDLAVGHLGQAPKTYEFRALAPLTNLVPFTVNGRQNGPDMELWARRQDGARAMQARAVF